MGAFKRGWCKPSAILFATECPPSERNFTVALAHAKESDAKLNLFHVAPSTARARMHYPGTNGAGPQTVLRVRQFFDPLAQRAWDMGIDCQVVLREGNAAEEILKYMGEWQVDRVVMGAHTAGPAGKPLVGSVADTLLRKAEVPVTIVSPFLAEGSYRNFLTRSVLCVVSAHQSSQAVARFAAELAMRYGARAVFQHIIPSQKQPGKQKHSVHPVSTFCQAPHEADQAMCNLLASMFDAGHWHHSSVRCIVTPALRHARPTTNSEKWSILNSLARATFGMLLGGELRFKNASSVM